MYCSASGRLIYIPRHIFLSSIGFVACNNIRIQVCRRSPYVQPASMKQLLWPTWSGNPEPTSQEAVWGYFHNNKKQRISVCSVHQFTLQTQINFVEISTTVYIWNSGDQHCFILFLFFYSIMLSGMARLVNPLLPHDWSIVWMEYTKSCHISWITCIHMTCKNYCARMLCFWWCVHGNVDIYYERLLIQV